MCLVAGFGGLYLIRYLIGYRGKPGALWLAGALFAQTLFVFAYAIGLTVFNQEIRWAIEIFGLVAFHWLGVPFLGFALEYTGRRSIRRSWYFRILFVFPLSVTLLLPLNFWHELFWNNFSVVSVFGTAVATYEFNVLFYITLVGALGWSMAGVLLLVDTVWDYGSLFRSEALAVALSPALPVVGLLVWLFQLTPETPLNWAAPLLIAHVMFDLYAFVGSDMFEVSPATNRAAKQSAISDFRAPVIVIEEEGRIVELNAAAETQLELDRTATLMQPLSLIFERISADETDGTKMVEQSLGNNTDWHITVQKGQNTAEYVVQSSPLTAGVGERVGYTLLFQDITEEIRREERLSVLNRILRHNLRNDLSVVAGYVSAADERTDDETVAGMLDKASMTVNDLIETGEMAREFEKVIAEPEDYSRSVSLGKMFNELEEKLVDEYPNAEVSTDQTGSTVQTNPDILRSVLWQLLDNAAYHDDSESTAIALSVTERDSQFLIEVVDDGPGIPNHEVQSLREGQETSLDHGSGFGLWLVKWGTTRIGGSVNFEIGESGTTVSITLPKEASPPVVQASSASA
nr:histidine kinase N-terminal 7TM domain-containing protein [Halovenus rubra]